MTNHLSRRGGIWWVRLVVPAPLRSLACRREFTQSTRTHELHVAKLIASVLLAEWRRQLFKLEKTQMEDKRLLKLIGGAPALIGGDHIRISNASEALGFDLQDLLMEAKAGRLSLWVLVGRASSQGYVVPKTALEPVDPALGVSGGVVIPDSRQMPPLAQAASMLGEVLLVSDSKVVAGEILADGLEALAFVSLDLPRRPGWIYCPSISVQVQAGELLVERSQLEGLRARVLASIPAPRIEAARKSASPAPVVVEGVSGKWANRLFSEAVTDYCTRSDGLAQNLADESDRRHRMRGMLLLPEFLGDKPLRLVDVDVLRAFRDRMTDFPDHLNRLKGPERLPSMTATIDYLRAHRPDYRRMTEAQRAERMQWFAQLFTWLCRNGYAAENPTVALKGESALTKAERIARAKVDEDDEDGRRPFTPAEITAIFSQPCFQTGDGSRSTKGNQVWRPFHYWLPLLALFGGVRKGEASQLHLDDVKQIEGHWCLDINRRTPDKSLKTAASVRLIPIHQQLVDLGFVDYCQKLRETGYRRVFPELTYSKGPARYGKEAGRQMSNMLSRLKMPRDGSLVFHCLRHNCNSSLQRATGNWDDPMLRLYLRYSVIGHELPDDVNASHYTWASVSEMARLVAGMEFGLPSIAPFNINYALDSVSEALANKMGFRKGREDMGPHP